MSTLSIGNAPCSWGTLEFEGLSGEPIPQPQMLDELVQTGYTGSELGDWGFMPTEPAALAADFTRRGLALTGAFVPVRLLHADAPAEGVERAVRTARLLADAAAQTGQTVAPFLVLADDNGSDPIRTQNAGRITPEMELSDEEWETFARGAQQVAEAVRRETGLRTVFHHHCAGYVETPDEIARLLELTDPQTLGLVFDTGHYVYAGGDCDGLVPALDRFAGRIWYVHFKDCDPAVRAAAAEQNWDYFEAVRRGVFCELGKGCVNFPAVLAWLRDRSYSGFITVEQDVLPGMGAPRESAQRNRDYLRQIGV